MQYDFTAIEKRWQDFWAERGTFRTPNPGDEGFDAGKPHFYVLDMFPYPSGVGLHVGHPLGYIATDIVARFKRARGFNVLHPMGYDAFGLPAEQFAVEHGVHPRITTQQNIDNMTRQLKRLGLSYDWDRCIATIEPDYYKWTQWIFLKLFNSYFDPIESAARPISELETKLENEVYYLSFDGELIYGGVEEDLEALGGTTIGAIKWHELTPEERRQFIDDHRLAYIDEVPVNWCPQLGTVLANEEVTNEGRSERGNYPVYRRPLKQWMLRITAYADRLADELDEVDWPESVKLLQRNWVGRSDGARVDFPVAGTEESDDPTLITVFTTRPDTLFGATYMVLAPEHPLVAEITTPEQRDAVKAYQKEAAAKTDVDRQAETKTKTGVFTGSYAINPVNDEKVPVWIADYVMMGYGTGAIMAVPAHDDRDFEFATQFGLPIKDVVYSAPMQAILAFCKRYEERKFDEDAGKGMLIDFVGLCVNQSRDDYDDVYRQVVGQREEHHDPNHLRSGRGTISMIWKETVEPMLEGGLTGLLQAAREGRLVEKIGSALTEDGAAVYSTNDEISLDGLDTDQAKQRITDWLEEKGCGKAQTAYKLRDWLFSRQRYWGEPFPVLHGPDGEIRALEESELPLELPEMEDFRPQASEDPEAPPMPPLSRAPESWKTVEIDGKQYTREFNTMPQWAGSCWYYLRFLDPTNKERFVKKDAEQYWMGSSGKGQPGGVDLYIGGVEHAVLHLLYARFWHKVLFDLGYVSTREPFGKLFNQGYIQAYYYEDERGVRVPAAEIEVQGNKYFYKGKEVFQQHGKMGKSLKNAIAPDEVCDQYGCDTLRLYEMYMGPLDQSKVWNTRDIIGVHRFLQRLWRNLIDQETGELLVAETAPSKDLARSTHRTIKRVTESMESMSFNTAIAALIELNNELVQIEKVPRWIAETMVVCLSPLAPHISEELWSRLGKEPSVGAAPWPTWDADMLVEAEVELPVQVQGKLRGKIVVPADADEDAILEAAKAEPNVAAHLEGKTIRKVIVIKGRLVNLVAT